MSGSAFVGIRRIRPGYPSLSARSQGWLRYLYRKATTPDSWDRDGRPHEHWDALSEAPMLSWHRFDLIDSCYAVALMADQTPAWREAYGVILDELVTRYTGWWSASDWLTQFGHDPARGHYPDYYRLLMPEDLWGTYDAPGWTANGVEPWGMQMDPIGADGNLFFKGWFLVVLGLYRRTTGDAKWSEPFDMVRDGELTFSWSHAAIVEHLVRQWSSRPEGCHCENTKVWPLCLTAAGLGLKLFDLLHGTDHHDVFRHWWRDKARHDYLGFDGDIPGAMTTFYYDPLIDRHHLLPAFASSSFVAYYLAAEFPDDARALWDSAREQLGLLHPPYSPALDPRGTSVYLFLANEWGENALGAAIREDARRATSRPGMNLPESSPGASPSESLFLAANGMRLWRRPRPTPAADGGVWPPSSTIAVSPSPPSRASTFPRSCRHRRGGTHPTTSWSCHWRLAVNPPRARPRPSGSPISPIQGRGRSRLRPAVSPSSLGRRGIISRSRRRSLTGVSSSTVCSLNGQRCSWDTCSSHPNLFGLRMA